MKPSQDANRIYLHLLISHFSFQTNLFILHIQVEIMSQDYNYQLFTTLKWSRLLCCRSLTEWITLFLSLVDLFTFHSPRKEILSFQISWYSRFEKLGSKKTGSGINILNSDPNPSRWTPFNPEWWIIDIIK